ncbi:hypothetical protein SLA2020_022080 [Shorea laevis]
MDMEKASYVVNGGIRMPIGYRFYPTDEELVTHYLTRKNLGLPLPASVIPELDVFQAVPWSLPGDLKEKYRYFFSNRNDNESMNVKGNKRKRVSPSGFWKTIGKERLIVASGSNQPVGMKKTLVFNQGKRSHRANSTRWLMHQYCLLPSTPTLDSAHQMPELFGDWFVYRIFQKKRKAKKHGHITPNLLPNSSCNNINNTPPGVIDFTVDDYSDDCGPPRPSSPSSTEEDLDQEDISFPSYSWMGK